MSNTPINERTVKLLLDRYGYYFYVIKRFPAAKCSCVDPTTKDANSKCKKCLGLGTQIKIYKVFGVIREAKEREISIAQSISVSPKIVYIKGIFYANKDDVIIDSENVYHILNFQYHRGENGDFQFTRFICPNTKSNAAPLIRNFKELLYEHNIRKNKN